MELAIIQVEHYLDIISGTFKLRSEQENKKN